MRDASRVAGCEGVTLVVSSEPARGVCPASAELLDRFTVWRGGAYAVWLDGEHVRTVSDRAERGQRPWVPPLPHPGAPALPMALSE